MKKFSRIIPMLLVVSLLLTLCACGGSASSPAAAGGAPGNDASDAPVSSSLPDSGDSGEGVIEAEGYRLWYRLVPIAEEANIVGDLAQYASAEYDESTHRLAFVQFVKAEKDGSEKAVNSVFATVQMGKMDFVIAGEHYQTSSMLLSSAPGNEKVFAYFAVPIDVGDDAGVEITYNP